MVRTREGDVAGVTLDGGSRVVVPSDDMGAVGGSVRIGVRPEKIRIESADGEVQAGWNSVEGTLKVAAFIGVSHQYTVVGPAGTTLTVYVQNLGGSWVPRTGETVRLIWRPEHTFVVKPSAPLADWEEEA